MHDITSAKDVAELIDRFYSKVVVDPEIGFFFTEVVQLSWDTHIPIMNAFWCSILLGTTTYNGNPMHKHFELDKKHQLTGKHFDRWLQLWEQTINDNFAGPTADEALLRAKNIAGIMQYKVAANRKP